MKREDIVFSEVVNELFRDINGGVNELCDEFQSAMNEWFDTLKSVKAATEPRKLCESCTTKHRQN